MDKSTTIVYIADNKCKMEKSCNTCVISNECKAYCDKHTNVAYRDAGQIVAQQLIKKVQEDKLKLWKKMTKDTSTS